MSLAVISIDTIKQECIFTMDGALVPVDYLYMCKMMDMNTGDPSLSLRYEVGMQDAKTGMIQKMEYMLAPKDTKDMVNHGYVMQNNGLASRVMDVVKTVIRDVSKYMNKE